jgi:hypothetical protein
LLVALVVWILSCGVFKGTPERHLKRDGDIYALVPCQDGRRGPATATEEQREAFYQAPDTWFDMTTPKNLD